MHIKSYFNLINILYIPCILSANLKSNKIPAGANAL